ncbi:granzyme K-like [Mobula birostris]|uniref:granzyme K-like n=1 Tax=Mobula birostris TaxID=1983395 RepID=UPI003B27C154
MSSRTAIMNFLQLSLFVLIAISFTPANYGVEIIGGREVKRHSKPYMVSIQKAKGKESYQHICGGALISKNWVLTAAHSGMYIPGEILSDVYTEELQTTRPLDYSPINANKGSSRGGQAMAHAPKLEHWMIRSGSLHPSDNNKKKDVNLFCSCSITVQYTFDICLILSRQVSAPALRRRFLPLESKAELNKFVGLLPLPHKESDLKEGTVCTVAGWGTTKANSNKASDSLREADVTIIDRKTCNNRKYYNRQLLITENMLCAGDKKGRRDACFVS